MSANVDPKPKAEVSGSHSSRGFDSQGNALPVSAITENELPKGWRWVRVKDIGNVQLGRQRAPKYQNGPNIRPYLRVANVFEDRIDLSDVLTMNFTPREFETFALRANDILLNEGQSLHLVGRPALYRDDLPGACFQNTLVRFRPGPDVEPKFALTIFRGYMHTGKFQKIARWTTNIAHLGAQRFAEMPFPLPPISQQRRIVAEIEKQFTRLDVGVEALRRVQANLKRYRSSVLNEAANVSWPSMMLSEISEVVTGSTPSKERPEYYGGTLPFIKPGDLNVGYRVEDAKEHLSEEGTREARMLPPNTVLVTCIGATIGKSGLARVPCATNQQINAVIPHDHIVLPEWVYWMISSPFCQEQIKAKASATTLPIINKGKFSTINLPIPPLAEQAAIVADIERRMSIADALQRSIYANFRRSDRLRQSILQAAFSGQL